MKSSRPPAKLRRLPEQSGGAVLKHPPLALCYSRQAHLKEAAMKYYQILYHGEVL